MVAPATINKYRGLRELKHYHGEYATAYTDINCILHNLCMRTLINVSKYDIEHVRFVIIQNDKYTLQYMVQIGQLKFCLVFVLSVKLSRPLQFDLGASRLEKVSLFLSCRNIIRL